MRSAARHASMPVGNGSGTLRPHPDVSAQHAIEFLAGDGEIARLIRGQDWSATLLGSPECWPPSLRNALRLVLVATEPMCIAWGPDLLLFPNDAMRQLVSPATRLVQVGGSSREVLRDMWPMLEPLIDRTTRRGESCVLEDQMIGVWRQGWVEETYVTLRIDPIPGDAGEIAGVLASVAATTKRVIGRRRAEALRGLTSLVEDARTTDEAARRALSEISRHRIDLPFALLYRREADGARLIATAGLPAGASASPQRIELTPVAGATGWPVGDALMNNRIVPVDDLPDRFPPLPAGDWPLAPRCALVMPLAADNSTPPDAVLIAGVSARRALDHEYRHFIDEVAGQVGAILTAGRAYEKRQAEAAAAAAKLSRALRRTRERALSARFAAVLEERTRLAREIHDTLLQGFTGVGLQLLAASERVTGPPEAVDDLRSVLLLVKKTLTEARCAVWDLRAPQLERRDFPATLRATAEDAAVAGGLALDFRVEGDPRPLDADLEAMLSRVAQEAMANVVKHAEAQIVRLSLTFGARSVRLSIRDDGRGFVVDPEFRAYRGHWGLLGMQERTCKVGGRLAVRSEPGKGTEVSLQVPYKHRMREVGQVQNRSGVQ